MPDGNFDLSQPHLSSRGLADQERCRSRGEKIAASAAELSRLDIPASIEPAEAEAAAAIEDMKTLAANSARNIAELHGPRDEAGKEAKAAKFAYRTDREASEPDVFWTVVTVWLFVAIETGATAMILAGDGSMGAFAAVLFGLVFGLANVAVAQLAGFLGLRNVLYRLRPEIEAEDPRPRRARLWGWVFLIGFGALFGILIFSAARVRYLGSHHDLFDLETVGFWETFDDAMVLLVVAIGVAAGAFNVLKGRSGWGESLPNFKPAFEACWRVDDEAEERAETAIEALDEVCERGVEVLDATRDELDELANTLAGEAEKITRSVKAHNADVRNAADRELRRQRIVGNARSSIRGTLPLNEQAIRRPYDALCLPEIDEALLRQRLADARGLIARLDALTASLEAARSREAATVEAHLGTYRASAARADTTLNWD